MKNSSTVQHLPMFEVFTHERSHEKKRKQEKVYGARGSSGHREDDAVTAK